MLSYNYIIYRLDKTKATSPGAEEGSSPRGTFGVLDVWRKYRVDSNKVNEWTANLRMVRIVPIIKSIVTILRIFSYNHFSMLFCQ